MNINVQTKSGLPIYEQIERQIKAIMFSVPFIFVYLLLL